MDHATGAGRRREDLDAAIARSARHGLVTRADAFALGATRRTIEHRLATGRWERAMPAVYRIAGAVRTWRQDLLAVCLWWGPGAVASHRAAARLWGMPGMDRAPLEITAPRNRSRVARPGLIVHRSEIGAADATVVDAIPVTGVARTLIDLAGVVERATLEEALDHALLTRAVSLARLRWRLDVLGARGRPGVAAIRAAIEGRGRVVPQSVFETKLVSLIRRARLPEPELQHPVRAGGRVIAVVDVAYPDARVAIEADGYRWHAGRVRWEKDLARRNALTALGWRVLHVTWSDVTRRPGPTADRIAEVLARTGRG